MITLNSTCITINALGWVVVLAVAIMVIAIIGFFNHDAYAASFDIKDQVSCQSLPSGSPSWDPSTNTCTVTNISITLNSGDSLTVENGIVFSDSCSINNNPDGTITNSARLTTDSCVITNSGTINNNSEGNIHIEDFNLIINSGTINNSGAIIIEVDSTINNTGTINNPGSFNTNGNLTNSGTITNSGSISNPGTINNSGTIINEVESIISNTGTINNLCPDGVINQNGILSVNPINHIQCI